MKKHIVSLFVAVSVLTAFHAFAQTNVITTTNVVTVTVTNIVIVTNHRRAGSPPLTDTNAPSRLASRPNTRGKAA